MAEAKLLRLARDLEWQGCELEHYGKKHALEGFPGVGATWEEFLRKQRGVLVTVDKITRELKSAVRYNPARLMGVEYPLDAALETVANLLSAVEDIRHTAVFGVHDLPHKVRDFTRMVETYCGKASPVSG